VTTGGVVSTVTLSTPNAGGSTVTLGADKKLWVAEGFNGALGRLSAIGETGKNFKATHGVSFRGNVASFVDGTPTATKADFTNNHQVGRRVEFEWSGFREHRRSVCGRGKAYLLRGRDL
jgi:hypothetical protein